MFLIWNGHNPILSTPLGLPVFFLLGFFWWVDLSSTLMDVSSWGSLFPAPFILWAAKGPTMTKTWARYFSWRWAFFNKKNKKLWRILKRVRSLRGWLLKNKERSLGASVEMWPFQATFTAGVFFLMSWSIGVFLEQTCFHLSPRSLQLSWWVT